MRLALLALVITAIVLVLSAGSAFAAPGVTVDHESGSPTDTFIFSAVGFEPGTVLKGKYTVPSGKEYGFSEGYGEKSFYTAADGTWQFSYSPSSSPNGASAGDWKMTFCLAQDASTCWSSTFKVVDNAGGGGITRTGGSMGGYY